MPSPMRFTRHPWKGVYLIYGFSAILFRLPLWILCYMWPSMRPIHSWSLGHTIAVQLTRCIADISTVTGDIVCLPNHRATFPADDAKAVWIDGTPHLMIAELKTWASVSKVEPERIPGYWYARKGESPMPKTPISLGQRVFYFLHGGGYIQLSAHPNSVSSNITRALVELGANFNSHALALEYRLSSTSPLPDENPFPAALLDALAGYNYLVNEMGYAPSDIILVGDSAGGNLALALTRYLVQNKGTPHVILPAPPRHLILLSPWADLSPSHDRPGSSTLSNTDYIGFHDSGRSLYSKRAFLGPFGLGFAFYNPYISPASLIRSDVQAHFAGFPRTFLATGSAERSYDIARTLAGRLEGEMGSDQVTFFEAKDAVHDFLLFTWHPCRPAVLEAIENWLRVAL